MHRLIMKNVGPVTDCDINLNNINIFTGAQASGKSTIAKTIFFFRTIKDDIREAIIKRNTLSNDSASLYTTIHSLLRNKFLQIFGSSKAMSSKMKMQYSYSENTCVSIELKIRDGMDFISPDFVMFDFSDNITTFITQHDRKEHGYSADMKASLTAELNKLFCDDYETIFIPAGRSLITLLTNQLNYIFTSMDDEQKRTLDFCTQKYVERILKIRPLFNNGILGYLSSKYQSDDSENIVLARKSIELSNEILKGIYVFVNGEERLYNSDDRFVKINFTSSGQQETVWIINILLYQMINNIKTFVILEEPEAHLYPSAQKTITELLAVFTHNNNSALITTHSPYILGTVNNLMLAHQISDKNGAACVEDIIDNCRQIDECCAYFVTDGNVLPCIEEFDNLIQNDIIDGAAQDINDDYSKLMYVLMGDEADAD